MGTEVCHTRDDDDKPLTFEALVIEALASENADLRERNASLAADCESYRDLAQEALHRIHALTETLRRSNDQHRYLREQMMREALARQAAA